MVVVVVASGYDGRGGTFVFGVVGGRRSSLLLLVRCGWCWYKQWCGVRSDIHSARGSGNGSAAMVVCDGRGDISFTVLIAVLER